MTRTFGPENAVAWVQVRLRGGVRNLLTTTATYSVVIGLAMIGSVELIPDNPGKIFGGWVLGMMALQAAVLLLFAPSRVAGAIRYDIASGIIESNRLMPIAPPQAVIGYLLGSTSQAMCLAFANVLLGGFAAIQAGIAPAHWLGANALLFAFAVFTWIILAFAAFHPRNPVGLIFILPGFLFGGQGGALGLAPGLVLLATPLLGASIFDMSVTLGGLRDAYALSIAAQILVGALCFTAAARKYRRSDVIGFTPILGLLLLATWVALSCIGTVWWDELRPRYMRSEWLTPQWQFITSLLIGMLLALVPVWAAAEQMVAWVGRRWLNDPVLGRRPLPDEIVVLAATLVLIPLAAGPEALILQEQPMMLPLSLSALTILLHLATTSYLRRALRYRTAKANGVLLFSLGILWVGPLLADLIRHEMLDRPTVPVPILTEISCVSPAGAIVALMTGRVNQVTIGLCVQGLLTVLVAVLHYRTHPLRGGGNAQHLREPAPT